MINKVKKYAMDFGINTLYNPYIKVAGGQDILEPITAGDYVDRSKDFPHKIDGNDLVHASHL